MIHLTAERSIETHAPPTGAISGSDADRAAPASPPVRRPTVTVLVPARNEERNIAWVLERLPSGIDEVILIDGRSTDRTVEIARMVRPDIRIVPERGRGKGAAVRTGIAASTSEVVVMLDADGSMDPGEIGRFVTAVADGADLAKGSRFMPGGGTTDITWFRAIGNRVLLGLVNVLFRTRQTELCYGYMAFRRSSITSLGLTADGFEIETEIVVRSLTRGLVVREVPSLEAPRRFGESNLNAVRDGLRILRTVFREWGAGRLSATVERVGAPVIEHEVEEPADLVAG